jgi:hypothetical protein
MPDQDIAVDPAAPRELSARTGGPDVSADRVLGWTGVSVAFRRRR